MMTDNKPYLLRAMYEWICDNELTPYLYVDTRISGVFLPNHLLEETPQVLNISPASCQQLLLSNDAVTFQARFSGQVFDVFLPINAIVAIVVRENGQGMTFEVSDNPETETTKKSTDKSKEKTSSNLKIVK